MTRSQVHLARPLGSIVFFAAVVSCTGAAPPDRGAPPAMPTTTPTASPSATAASGELLIGVCTPQATVAPPEQMPSMAAALRGVVLQAGERSYRIKFGECPPGTPPCFADARGILCRAESLRRPLRAGAYLALRYVADPNKLGALPERMAADADTAALSADPTIRDPIDGLMALDERDAPAPEGQMAKAFALYKIIGKIHTSFLVGHELFHTVDACPLTIPDDVAARVSQMTTLDQSNLLFCPASVELKEVLADRCGLAHLASLNAAIDSATDGLTVAERDFARRAGAAMLTWYVMSNWLSAHPGGAIRYVQAPGYLRSSLRGLLAASQVAPKGDGGRACGEAAALIVTAVQNDVGSCPGNQEGNPPYDRRTASPLKLVRDRWHPVMRRHWDVTIEDGAGEWFVAESAEVDGRGCA